MITFKDVAKRAGVSTQTVSRVTNGGKGVKPETLKKVQQAIDELGYVPNKGAQMLVRSNAKAIGVITMSINFQGATQIVESIRKESHEFGYSMLISVAETSLDSLENSIRELRSMMVDAIIINLALNKDIAETLVNKYPNLHFLFIDVPQNTQVCKVASEHYLGAKQAAELMIKHNRKRFALVNGPLDSDAALERQRAWKDVIKENKAELINEAEGNWSAESGYLQTCKLLSISSNFNALLIANDQMALGALRAIEEHNLTIPDDIAVIGFDDTNNSEYFQPPLTTIRQDFVGIGKQAVKTILDQLEDNNFMNSIKIKTQLIERRSTAPLIYNKTQNKNIDDVLKKIKKLLPE